MKYGVIVDIGFDPDHSIFADVKFLPNGEQETVYVGSNYAGDGYGEWNPLAVNDVVEITYPEGTAEATPVITARIWQAARKPPSQFAGTNEEPTQDKVLVVKPGQKYRIYVSQGGEVDIATDNSSFAVQASAIMAMAQMVALGQAGGQPITFGASTLQFLTTFLAMLTAMEGDPLLSVLLPVTFSAVQAAAALITTQISTYTTLGQTTNTVAT